MITEPNGHGFFSAVAADLDGDGDVDLATEGYGWVLMYENAGGSPLTILPKTYYPAPSGATVNAIDWNADGRIDLMSVGSTGLTGTWSLLINQSTPSQGLSNFGTGTGGCYGRLGLGASSVPSLGNAAFALTATHAPKSAAGFGIIGTADTAGSNPANLGILLHVGLATPLFAFPMQSDRAGTTHTLLPIPANPMLVGQQFAFQAIFPESVGDACGSSSGLVSSRGLQITVQP